MKGGNVFSDMGDSGTGEFFEPLLETGVMTIERIISQGHASPEGFWYDQDRNEWVLILRGSAGLTVEGLPDTVVLREGDYFLIPAHVRHRVEWTDPEGETVWLAVHYGELEVSS